MITRVRYNVYVAKAERKSASHLKRATRTVYVWRELTTAEVFTRWWGSVIIILENNILKYYFILYIKLSI